MKILRTVILTIFVLCLVLAQSKSGALLGTVINIESREPIALAKVTILETNY